MFEQPVSIGWRNSHDLQEQDYDNLPVATIPTCSSLLSDDTSVPQGFGVGDESFRTESFWESLANVVGSGAETRVSLCNLCIIPVDVRIIYEDISSLKALKAAIVISAATGKLMEAR